MPKTYAGNLARSNSNSSKGIAGRGVTIQATERDLSNTKCHYCSKFGHYKNDFADFKVVRQQDQRRRQRQHKQRGGHQLHQPKPGAEHQQKGRGKVCCSYHRTTSDANCCSGRQTSPTATPTSPKSVLRVFLGSAARGFFMCEMNPTRSPESHSRRERSSLQRNPPKPKWRRRREPRYLAQPRRYRGRGGVIALGHLLRVLSRPFPLEDR